MHAYRKKLDILSSTSQIISGDFINQVFKVYAVVKSSDLSLHTAFHKLNETFHPFNLGTSYSFTLANLVINEAKFASLFFSDLFRYYIIEVIILKTFNETETHYQNRLIC